MAVLESLLADIRFAVRWLRKSPGFTLVAVASLAIGIGFNTALFAVVDALLFKPLPVAAADRLVDLFTSNSFGTSSYSTSSYPDYVDLSAANDVFEGMAGYSPMFAALNLDGRSRLAMGEIVSGNYFQVLGVPAAVGRTILPSDDVPGAARVAMVSHRYWTRELGAAPDVVGKTLRLRGNAYVVVGVTPRDFNGMVPVLAPELWIPVVASLDVEPVGMRDAIPSPTGTTRLDRRADRWMFIRARLKPGATVDQARANLSVLMSRLDLANPITNKDRRLTLKATNDVHFHPSVDPVAVPIAVGLMVVVGLVLLIVCANVASMLLARASGRQKEIGIRLAIGASRGRLVQQLLTESSVLSSLGAAGGLLLAWWATRILSSLTVPLPIPLVFDLRIDVRVLAFTLGATALAGVLAGLVPALQASKPNLVADLRGEAAGSRTAGRLWTLRDALVAGQIAVTALLLVVAALLTRSLVAAQRTSVGFPANHLAIVSTDTGLLGYTEPRSRQFYDQAVARVSAIPGVESTALVTRVQSLVQANGLTTKRVALEGNSLIVRLTSADLQTKAANLIRPALGSTYTVALNLASTVPNWLQAIGGKPMSLGLDLQGGVHFLMEVDEKAAIEKRSEAFLDEVRTVLRENQISYDSVSRDASGIRILIAHQQISECRLAHTTCAQNHTQASGRYLERDAVQNCRAIIAEGDVFHSNTLTDR